MDGHLWWEHVQPRVVSILDRRWDRRGPVPSLARRRLGRHHRMRKLALQLFKPRPELRLAHVQPRLAAEPDQHDVEHHGQRQLPRRMQAEEASNVTRLDEVRHVECSIACRYY